MNQRDERLDDHVRRLHTFDESQLAALGDPVARQALFEEIVRMETTKAPVSGPRRARWALAGVATVVVVAVGWAMVASRDRQVAGPTTSTEASASTQATASPGPRGDIYGPNDGFKCVEVYSENTLAKRGFAFDGTVTSIGRQASPDMPYVPVTFNVSTWYRGGKGATVVVGMLSPSVNSSVHTVPFRIGSRLLVSGEAQFSGDPAKDPIAWACGFTRWHTDADAEIWRRAFS